MLSLLLTLVAADPAAGACPTLKKDTKVLLVVVPIDPALERHRAPMDRAVRKAVANELRLMPSAASARALNAEGGQEAREKVVLDARVQMQRAEDRFRELDDEVALSIIANVTSKLAAAQQETEAIELSSKAHLLAGAIYLARDRVDAARQRLRRALDLEPNLQPASDRFSPRLVAEVAAVRAAENLRPVGRLLVKSGTPGVQGEVFLDGRSIGTTPVTLDAVGAGRRLLRVSAPGRLSYATTVEIAPAKDVELAAPLDPDQEIGNIRALALAIRSGGELGSALKLLERRGDADKVLLAELGLASTLSPTGTPTVAITFHLAGFGRTHTESPSPTALRQTLNRLLRCEVDAPRSVGLAPSMLGEGSWATTLEPIPEARGFWEQPWFWAVCGVATLGLTGALVATRAAQGPPEAVDVTLSTRP
jgi:hypothetical protein